MLVKKQLRTGESVALSGGRGSKSQNPLLMLKVRLSYNMCAVDVIFNWGKYGFVAAIQ